MKPKHSSLIVQVLGFVSGGDMFPLGVVAGGEALNALNIQFNGLPFYDAAGNHPLTYPAGVTESSGKAVFNNVAANYIKLTVLAIGYSHPLRLFVKSISPVTARCKAFGRCYLMSVHLMYLGYL
jgi:hypothetical protein